MIFKKTLLTLQLKTIFVVRIFCFCLFTCVKGQTNSARTRHCIFKWQPTVNQAGWHKNVATGLAAIGKMQSPRYKALPLWNQSHDYSLKCDWITYVRCDLDDWLSTHYVNMALKIARENVAVKTPTIIGLNNINRFVFDYTDKLYCDFQSNVKTPWPTSLGLTVTIPCTKNYRTLLRQSHAKIANSIKANYNTTKTFLFSGDRFATAPVTRLSGHFPWETPLFSLCGLRISKRFANVLKVIANITVEAACQSNQFLRSGPLKLKACS